MKKRRPHRRSAGPQAGKIIIIVDLQRAFSPPPRLVRHIERYASGFPRRVFTRFVNPPGSPFRRDLKQRCCIPGSPDTELLVNPKRGDLVVQKAGYGLDSNALRRIRRLRFREAIVCGIETDACVLGVMFSLFDAGIRCRVKASCCWSSTGLHRAGLSVIRKQFPNPL